MCIFDLMCVYMFRGNIRFIICYILIKINVNFFHIRLLYYSVITVNIINSFTYFTYIIFRYMIIFFFFHSTIAFISERCSLPYTFSMICKSALTDMTRVVQHILVIKMQKNNYLYQLLFWVVSYRCTYESCFMFMYFIE